MDLEENITKQLSTAAMGTKNINIYIEGSNITEICIALTKILGHEPKGSFDYNSQECCWHIVLKHLKQQ